MAQKGRTGLAKDAGTDSSIPAEMSGKSLSISPDPGGPQAGSERDPSGSQAGSRPFAGGGYPDSREKGGGSDSGDPSGSQAGNGPFAGGDLSDSREKGGGSADSSDGEDENENNLTALAPHLRKGRTVTLDKLSLKEGKTSPPKRYTSGSMILAMENAGQLIEDEELRAQIKGAGIGTSATRAGIIEKLVKIGYLALNKKTQILTPQKFGEMVYEVVFLTMPGMLNPEMTASWEKGLSGVEKGEISPSHYRKTLEQYVTKYVERVKARDLQGVLKERIRNIGTPA
ncbi:MAG: hypothetical protein K5989_02410 [Lachnospiraceae bacterium]|nr:hypothetical protein [Lachnospiraceae bacterium]